jgi:hypothetical protein
VHPRPVGRGDNTTGERLTDADSAIPTGLSRDALAAEAELVAHVQVVSIQWATDKTSPHLARLRPLEILKGQPRYRSPRLARLRLDRTIEVKMRRVKRDRFGRPLPGEWSDGYREGDHVITHLVWNEAQGGYITLAWNAVWQTPN